jgi:hypothetical protein
LKKWLEEQVRKEGREQEKGCWKKESDKKQRKKNRVETLLEQRSYSS